MEKILQILFVFALLVVAVTYFTRGRRPLYRAYVFSGQKSGIFLPEQGRWLGVAGESWEVLQPVRDAENQLLLRRGGAERQVLEMVEEGSGALVAAVSLGAPIDVILFDAGTRYIYCASWQGKLFVIRQLGREEYRLQQTVDIPEGSDGMALDPADKTLYVQRGDYYYVYTKA